MTNYVQRVVDRLTAAIPHDLEPELLRLYALLVLTKGTDTTLRDIHDAWSVFQHVVRPDHRSLVPFDQLPTHVQELDRKFMEYVHAVALVEGANA